MYVYCVESFATVLFNVCSARHCRVLCLVCLLLCKEECSYPVFAITERRDMGLCEVPLSMSLLGFGMRIMLANFHMYGIMLVLIVFFYFVLLPLGPEK